MIKYQEPIVSPTFIDKLYLAVDVESSEHEKVKDAIQSCIDAGSARVKPNKNYQLSARLEVGEGYETALIQCAPHPHHADWSFVRLEFNPRYIGPEGMCWLKVYLDNILPNGYDSILEKGRCNRIDVTFDISHVSINRLMARYPKMQASQAYYKSGKPSEIHHNVETYNIGAKDAKRHFCIYDKVAEIKNHNSKNPYNKKVVPSCPTTRVEVKNRYANPVSSLISLPNQFAGLQLIAYHKVPKDDWFTDMVLGLAWYEGLQNVLLRLPDTQRKKALKIIQESKVKFWNPEDQWESWQSAIDYILYPPMKPKGQIHPAEVPFV